MFFKIPINADLTNTSYRCYKEVEDICYIEYNEGFVGDDWQEISDTEAREVAPEWFFYEANNSEPTQLDRIEENVNKLVTETTVTDVLLGVE